jgi:hypothetical protein
MSYRMTKADAWADFKARILPAIQKREQQYGNENIDGPLRSEAWNNYIDCRIKRRDVPASAVNWSYPKGLFPKSGLSKFPRTDSPATESGRQALDAYLYGLYSY